MPRIIKNYVAAIIKRHVRALYIHTHQAKQYILDWLEVESHDKCAHEEDITIVLYFRLRK